MWERDLSSGKISKTVMANDVVLESGPSPFNHDFFQSFISLTIQLAGTIGLLVKYNTLKNYSLRSINVVA